MKLLLFYSLVYLGLILRVTGLQYYGNVNYTDYRKIGSSVRTQGLVESYGQGYFPVAWLIFGASDYLSTFTPSNWWWAYKAGNMIFEILILLVLFIYLSKHKWKTLFMYWLNPWFLIPGSWQGFWDAPYTLFILLAVIVLDRKFKNSNIKYLLSGLLISTAITIKPQAFAPAIVLFFYFLLVYLKKYKFRKTILFIASISSLPIFFSLYFFLNGKPLLFLFKWYAAPVRYAMPFLVSSEINIWHTVTRIIMYFQNRTGPIYSLNAYEFPYNIMEFAAGLSFLTLLYVIVRIYTEKNKPPKLFFLKIMTFSLILLPQILTRSHAYHFYPATLLLIPLIIIENDQKLFVLWIFSVIIHFYNIWYRYGLGDQLVSPISLPGEPVLSVLGFISFLVTISFIYHFLRPPKIYPAEKDNV